MHDKVCVVLRELEKEHECRILFAAESGSRAWGFASPDSDYDIRAIYVKPHDWYLSIAENPKDTFEAMLPGDLDVSAWELRKALRLFAGCNLLLFEWLGSPIQYYAEEPFASEIKSLISRYFNPIKTAHHYLAMHDKGMADLDSANSIGIKKIFYALRGFCAALWSVEKGSMPPTEFEKLLLPKLIPKEIQSVIASLQCRKAKAVEKERVELPVELARFFAEHRAEMEAKMTFLPKPVIDSEALNCLFRQVLSVLSNPLNP